MARKIKIPNERLKRYARKEHKRKQDIKRKRIYYLIVCEGEATEPNYFEGLKQDLPVRFAERVWNLKDAIRNARRLAENFKGRQDYANHNPCTMVWELVRELMELKI